MGCNCYYRKNVKEFNIINKREIIKKQQCKANINVQLAVTFENTNRKNIKIYMLHY